MKKFILFLFLLMPAIGFSQSVPDINARSPKPEKTSRVQKKAEKKKEKKKIKQDKVDKKLRKQVVGMQTKEVRKRMRKNKHKAGLYNGKKREFWLALWFNG